MTARQESPRFYAATPPVRSGVYKVWRQHAPGVRFAAIPEFLHYDVEWSQWTYGDAIDSGAYATVMAADQWCGLLAPCQVE